MPVGKKTKSTKTTRADARKKANATPFRKGGAADKKAGDKSRGPSTKASRAAERKVNNSRAFSKGGAADKKSKTGTATRGPSGARKAYAGKKK